ncbi:YtxH domain-containing protein [Holzapfeliella sp. He02]|uniref:YtxH domain-containing protein n=1 Tax=Holzapfeliella saturejae TaxID=3082953 RepID=A0ABU8SGZ4_9LACO
MKNFLLGSLLGAAAGVLLANTQNKNTGNTFGKDFSNGIKATGKDLEDINLEREKIKENLNYLQTEGMKTIEKFGDDVNQEIEEFNYYAEPHIARLQQKVRDLESKLENDK